MTLDRVQIHDLLLRCIVGINPDERDKPQDVLVNLTMHVDVRRPGATDDIGDAVNYKQVTKRVIQLVENSHFFLVERLATEIARLIVTEFPAVARVSVQLEKPGALRYARSVGVLIERTAADFADLGLVKG